MSAVVEMMEAVMVVDGLTRAAKTSLAEWRYCGGCVITVSTPSYVVVT